MPTIFISYRRADSASDTGRLYDRLVERYGRASVFKDVDSIPPGMDFATYIAQSIQASDVTLAVIGPRWLDASTSGVVRRRRLDDPADFVRVEIETALRLGVTVIPVLVGGASLPAAKRLPASLRPLLRQNGVPLRQDPDFAHDVERVFAAVDYWQAQPRRSRILPASEAVAPKQAMSSPTSQTTTSAALASKPTAARTATAVAERVGIATPRRAAWRARVAPALTFFAALAVVAVAVALLQPGSLGGLFPNAGATRAAQETQTAQAQPLATERAQAEGTETAGAQLAMQRYQPPGGIGPCDTNAAEVWTGANQAGWEWEKHDTHGDVQCGDDKKTAILKVDPVDRNNPIPFIIFTGFPYDRSGFPSQFTASMTVTFTGYDTAGVNQEYCATIGTRLPFTYNESTNSQSAFLGVCRDGSWYLNDASHQQAGSLTSPLHVQMTVDGNRMSISVNNQQLMPMTTFDASGEQIAIAVLGNTSDTITVNDFVLQPIAA